MIVLYMLGLNDCPLQTTQCLSSLLRLHLSHQPLPPHPPWLFYQQNDAFLADIAGILIALLVYARLMCFTDPHWSTREPTWHYPQLFEWLPSKNTLPDAAPPWQSPNLLEWLPSKNTNPYHSPLTYTIHTQPHHKTLHRLAHLHQLESKHLRLLALHHRLPLRLPIHLLQQFCPSVPPTLPPLWTDEGDFNPPTQLLQVHPTIAKTIRISTVQKLAHTVKLAVGFSVSDQFDNTEALDVDSKPFGIDPMASATISNNKNEFSDLRPLTTTFLAGVGGKVPVEGVGTLVWDIEDDQGMIHKIKINDAYYCSQAPLRLLCPQQWAAQREKQLGPDHNTSFTTNAHYSRLRWSEFMLTVPHDDKTNLPLWRTAPGYCQVVMNTTIEPPRPKEPALISDDEDSLEDDEQQPKPIKRVHFPFHSNQEQQSPLQTQETGETAISNDQIELLKLHNKFGHISFRLLKNMAQQKLIPHKLATVEPPKCSSCLYGKQTKRPWRTKAKPTPNGGHKATQPGQCGSTHL